MIKRLLSLPESQSFFLFGPRGTGKTTLVQSSFPSEQSVLLNLLDFGVEERFAKNPNELSALVQALPKEKNTIIIDEIQKVPRLLDIVHHLIETTSKQFVLTGSSARKLKRGGANLLAGRAFVYHLHPFSFVEMGTSFHLPAALQWGMLPKIQTYTTDAEKMQFLQAYAHTYLKEEIWSEHFIQALDPFRRFLEVAAQMNGKIINFSKISADVGVDDKTIKKYYAILEDTLLGFFLEAFRHSFRKRLSTKPKFYFFDPGVVHALTHTLSVPTRPSTSSYGDAFEHLVILECKKLASYFQTEFRFSYLKTKDDAEIDLVIERPGLPPLLIEIKSTQQVQDTSLSSFIKMAADFGECEAVCFSQDPYEKMINTIRVMPWQEGVKKYFNGQ